jgi:hypothetical protein
LRAIFRLILLLDNSDFHSSDLTHFKVPNLKTLKYHGNHVDKSTIETFHQCFPQLEELSLAATKANKDSIADICKYYGNQLILLGLGSETSNDE